MIALIGGSGFIGTRLASRLHDQGTAFVIMDVEPSKKFHPNYIKLDVSKIDDQYVPNHEISTIVNLAAAHRDDIWPLSIYNDINVTGAENTCRMAERLGVNRIVFISSVAVYGFSKDSVDINGAKKPFNEYGRTKLKAEEIYAEWYQKDPKTRSLIIIRPTAVFGESNRGNVYNLINQIHNRRFVMIGKGENRKSLAYVENVAAFIEHSLSSVSGMHFFNYVDTPDFRMVDLVRVVRSHFGMGDDIGFKLPYALGLAIGYCFDFLSFIARRNFNLSSVRVRKFCSDTVFQSNVEIVGFKRPVSMNEGLRRTLNFEFPDTNSVTDAAGD